MTTTLPYLPSVAESQRCDSPNQSPKRIKRNRSKVHKLFEDTNGLTHAHEKEKHRTSVKKKKTA